MGDEVIPKTEYEEASPSNYRVVPTGKKEFGVHRSANYRKGGRMEPSITLESPVPLHADSILFRLCRSMGGL